MRLLDTSVWIEFLRRKGDPAVKRHVANLISANEAAFTCPVRFELMYGALDQELPQLERALSFAERIEFTTHHWDLAADAGRILRKSGRTLPHDDLLIATVAQAENVPVVCRDKHFSALQSAVFSQLQVEQL